MDLEERVAALERRLAALEEARPAAVVPGPAASGPAAAPGASAERDPDDELWALHGFTAQLAALGADSGGVLYTGAVRLPTGERYEWQYGRVVDDVLEDDWSAAADVLAALGQPVRMRLMRAVLDGRRTAAALTELEGLGTTGQVYHHLRQLTAAGWLHATARGRYEVPGARVVPLLVMITAAGR